MGQLFVLFQESQFEQSLYEAGMGWSFSAAANRPLYKANAYVSGMKEEINVVGNEYQTFTTMWTVYVENPGLISELANASTVAMSSVRFHHKSFAREVDAFPSRSFDLLELTRSIVRVSIWCPSWELLWVVATFASSSVKTPHQLYVCRFFVCTKVQSSDMSMKKD